MPVLSTHIPLNYLVFQVVTLDTETKETREIYATNLAVFPNNISYTYPSRATVMQTIEDKDGLGGFRDEPGRGLASITIRGTMGYTVQLEGISLKTGWQRLREFREFVVKLGHAVPGGNISQDQRSVLLPSGGLWERQVVCVNFYDFLNDEQMCVDIVNCNILEAMQSNRLPIYTISLKEAGPIVRTQTNLMLLRVLLAASELYSSITSAANTVLNSILASSYISGLATAASYMVAINSLMTDATDGLQQQFDTVENIFSGNPISSSVETVGDILESVLS